MDVSEWSNIVAVAAGYNYTVGLKEDGTVVAVGNNDYGQLDVSEWILKTYEQPSDMNFTVTSDNQVASEVSGYSNITVSGKIYSSDPEVVTISASIAGVEKTVTLTIPSTLPPEDNWSLTWDVAVDNLSEGQYSNIEVTADNGQEIIGSAVYTGTIIVDKTPPVIDDFTVTVNSPYQTTVSAVATDTGGAGLNDQSYLYNRNQNDVLPWRGEQFIDSGLIPNSQYSYKVKVRDTVGNESEYSQVITEYTLEEQQSEFDRALLVITLTNGTIKEYDVSSQEIDTFINWYENRANGTGKPYYIFDKNYNLGPFTGRNDYLIYDTIFGFEVMAY